MLFRDNPLNVEYALEDDSLYCRRPHSTDRILPAGPNAGAWQRKPFGDWTPLPFALHLLEIEDAAAQPTNHPRLLPSHRRRIEAARFLVQSWPAEHRHWVRRFPSAHGPLLLLLNQAPQPALEVLESNPALAFLLATQAPPDEWPHLLPQKRKQLAARFGFAPSNHSVRLLAKLTPESILPSLFPALRQASQSPDADQALSHLPQINPAVLTATTSPDWLQRFSHASLQQLTRHRPTADPKELAEKLDTLARDARERHLPLPPVRTLRDIDDALRPPPPPPRPPRPRGQQKTRQRRPFPAPPLQGTESILPLRSHQALAEESAHMQHCIGTNAFYARQIEDGRLFAYRILAPQRLSLTIRLRAGRWYIDELKGLKNCAPLPDARLAIESWLARPQPTTRPTNPNQFRLDFDEF
jgi:hypothetical protein